MMMRGLIAGAEPYYTIQYSAHRHIIIYIILVALIGGVEIRIATYKIAICFHLLLLSLLTVGRFRRVSVSLTKDKCPGVN